MFIKFKYHNDAVYYYPVNSCKFVTRGNDLYLIDGEEEINLDSIGLSETVQQYLDGHSLTNRFLGDLTQLLE